MHIAVFADIEGSFGIWRMRQCRAGTAEWQYGRSCLTEDVNHAIEGAFEGGADRVTVKDTHEVGFNCLIDQLDKRARYIGGHYTRPTFFGDLSDIDMIFYIAIHAASGTENAFFPHTHYGIFSEVTVNGRRVCEMDLYGGYLGELGIPIGLVSGEDIAVEQALESIPWAKSVVVDKNKSTYTNGQTSLDYLNEGRDRLREAAAEAVRSYDEMKPLVFKGPLHFKAVFRSKELADRFNTWNFSRQGDTVEWDADSMIEGFDMLNKLTFFPRNRYLFRRPLSFLTRQYFYIKYTWFAPDPNPEEAANFAVE